MGKDMFWRPALTSALGPTPMAIGVCAGLIAIAALVLAGTSDVERRRIPNRLSYLFGLCGVVFLFSLPSAEAVASLLLAGSILLLGTLGFSRGWLGGGDVKLLTGAMLWSGLSLLPLFLSVLAVTTLGMALIMATQSVRTTGRLTREDIAKAPMPFGVAIAVAAICVIAHRVPVLFPVKG